MQHISIGFAAGLLWFLLLCCSLLPFTKESQPQLSPCLERFNCKMLGFENKKEKKKIIVFDSSEILIVLEFPHRRYWQRFVSAKREQKDHSKEINIPTGRKRS